MNARAVVSTETRILHLVGGPLHGQIREVEHETVPAVYITGSPGLLYLSGARWRDEHGKVHQRAYYEEQTERLLTPEALEHLEAVEREQVRRFLEGHGT